MRPRLPLTPEPAGIRTHQIDPAVTGRSGPALRILLLEDRDDFREVVQEYLVVRSYQVRSVNSGAEGLRQVMKDPPDLIICDMMMPQMNGEMFYWAATRARPATRQRFIFFTGHKNNPALEHFFQRISATVLYKPFKMSELDATIADVLRRLA